MNKGIALFLVVVFLAACCVTFQPAKAEPRRIVVPDDYEFIQAAVNAAADGDVVYVKAGSYPENVEVWKPISLVGEDIDGTRITGSPVEKALWPLTIACSGVSVTGFSLVDSWVGIYVAGAHDCVISGNKILNNHYGIMLTSASGNTITENVIESVKSGAIGIEVRDTSTFPHAAAITLQNNSIVDNTITHCSGTAIAFGLTKNNLVAGNTISNCGVALSLGWTTNNTIYHNNFIDNTKLSPGGPQPAWWESNEIWYSTSRWDNGTEGNFWSNYNGADADGDGIGDTPYTVNENNTDNYPLMNQYATPAFTASSADPSLPFPNIQVIAVIAAVTVASVGLFVFAKKYWLRWNVNA